MKQKFWIAEKITITVFVLVDGDRTNDRALYWAAASI